MHRTAHFNTAKPEEWTFDAHENPDVPGGKALAEKLRSGAASATRDVSVVSQHSYYGWRFEIAFDGVRVDCVLNAAGNECYLTIEVVSIFPSWLLPKRFRRALDECERGFDASLRELPEITNVEWS